VSESELYPENNVRYVKYELYTLLLLMKGKVTIEKVKSLRLNINDDCQEPAHIDIKYVAKKGIIDTI